MNTWRVLSGGLIEVNGSVPYVDAIVRRLFVRGVMRWTHSVAVASWAYMIPAHWILGTIWAESAGDPRALSPDGGYGLMQLTSRPLFRGAKPEDTRDDPNDPTDDVIDPAYSIALGAWALKDMRAALPEDLRSDLVAVASCYNAGQENDGSPHGDATSPWGFRESPGHILRVVRGANTAIAELPNVPGCYTWDYVREWQKAIGIKDDGKFGPFTLGASQASCVR